MFGERKRKSNFDVPPEAMVEPSGITAFMNLPQSILNGSSNSTNYDPMKEVERLKYQFCSTGEIPGLYAVATDPAFTARLEKAIEKNFEYILRYCI